MFDDFKSQVETTKNKYWNQNSNDFIGKNNTFDLSN